VLHCLVYTTLPQTLLPPTLACSQLLVTFLSLPPQAHVSLLFTDLWYDLWLTSFEKPSGSPSSLFSRTMVLPFSAFSSASYYISVGCFYDECRYFSTRMCLGSTEQESCLIPSLIHSFTHPHTTTLQHTAQHLATCSYLLSLCQMNECYATTRD
jgi:hypothetical protein